MACLLGWTVVRVARATAAGCDEHTPAVPAASVESVNENGAVELRTERLILRPVRVGDVDELVAMHADPVTRRVFGEWTRDRVEDWVDRSVREWEERGHGKLTILDRESGTFIGRSGLRFWPEFEEVEVGWVLMPAARGRGVATEAGRACIEWGFRDFALPYVTAYIGPANANSIAVAERLGMTPLREDVLHGEPIVVHALRRQD
jgi:RimJ/RimL family protein N-acetyltransferase